MHTCPFCKAYLPDSNTFCRVCGYSFVLPLPHPVLLRSRLYLALAMLSILSGILSCGFSFIPTLSMASLFLVMGALALAGITLEGAKGKSQALLVKILAVLGLFFGILGYVCFMFMRSNVPGIGYTM